MSVHALSYIISKSIIFYRRFDQKTIFLIVFVEFLQTFVVFVWCAMYWIWHQNYGCFDRSYTRICNHIMYVSHILHALSSSFFVLIVCIDQSWGICVVLCGVLLFFCCFFIARALSNISVRVLQLQKIFLGCANDKFWCITVSMPVSDATDVDAESKRSIRHIYIIKRVSFSSNSSNQIIQEVN